MVHGGYELCRLRCKRHVITLKKIFKDSYKVRTVLEDMEISRFHQPARVMSCFVLSAEKYALLEVWWGNVHDILR
jgi:hypothetical protein